MIQVDKKKSQALYNGMRDLWNEWNPYGAPSTIKDEYDSYLGKTLHMLEAGASTEELIAYLSDFGGGGSMFGDPAVFAKKLQAWYSKHQNDAKS